MAEESCSCYLAAMRGQSSLKRGSLGETSPHRVEGASFMKIHTEDCMEEAQVGGSCLKGEPARLGWLSLVVFDV